jgi:predicted NACHT family NTPase
MFEEQCMTSRSGSQRDVVLPRWIRPFHRCWKPLAWIWGGLFFGVFINVGSSWLSNKNFDMSGTPLGWGVNHLWITLPPLLLLVLLTLLAGLASMQEHAGPPASPLTLTPKQRLQFIRGFQQEYISRLTSSLQEQMALELHLQERSDVIASSASLVFHHLETGQASPLPLGTSIIQAYDKAQRGLLILGAPGSGKTTLLLELAGELLQRAENDPDHPVSIILNLASWAKTQLPLAQWLGEQCSLVYGIPKHLSAAWIAQEQVQFLLDGLDEVGTSARTGCIEAINSYRRAHLVPLVVCSRSQEYEAQPAHLILPGAVEIQPLEPAQVSTVLEQAGQSLASVQVALHSNAILSDLLTTPLILSIAILTYRDKTLKELPQSGSPQDQQRQIFEQYVQHMLKRYQQRRSFSLAPTTSSLVWLAQQMQQRHLTEFHLESLQTDWLSPRRARIAYRLVVGLLFGLVVGLVGGLCFGGKAYVKHYVLRWFLAHSRALPWRTVPFLEEAKACILLQRVGGGYRFVHPLLQEYFASLPLSLTT